jgi:hypothetical protein
MRALAGGDKSLAAFFDLLVGWKAKGFRRLDLLNSWVWARPSGVQGQSPWPCFPREPQTITRYARRGAFACVAIQPPVIHKVAALPNPTSRLRGRGSWMRQAKLPSVMSAAAVR